MKNVIHNKGCRICNSKRLIKILDFGMQPLANAFLNKKQLEEKEKLYPLEVFFCRDCHLVQLKDVVSAEILFKDYVYVSSTSPLFIEHFQNFSKIMCSRFQLNKQSLVIDIGSNDGILLRPYKEKGIKVLGVEPAENVAKIAREDGIETISKFFDLKVAKEIQKRYGLAHLITATNVFAHINDIQAVVHGVDLLLEKDGVFIIEAPYLVDFLEKNLFDTVYHEHLSYFSLLPLMFFFTQHKLRVFDVERVSTHGGSLRIFVTRKNSKYPTSPNVTALVSLERKRKLHLLTTYQYFAKRIEKNKNLLMQLLNDLKNAKKKIVGYGAPAKGNTLMNYFGITSLHLNYIVDDSVFKQGLYTPGNHIPVVSPKTFNKDHPDFILILAWNFGEAIMSKYAHLRKKGVKFILPVPKPQLA